MGKRHQLEFINILTDDAHLNENVPDNYRGLDRFEARKKVVADLESQNLIEKKTGWKGKTSSTTIRRWRKKWSFY